MKEKDTEIMAKHNDHSINDRTNYTTVRLDEIALKEITKSSFKYDPWEKAEQQFATTQNTYQQKLK